MTAPLISDAARRARIGQRHALAPATQVSAPAAVAEAVLCLHSSDPASVYLSALARMRDAPLTAIEASLYGDRSLVRHHAMRSTLWVMSPEVARLAHHSSTLRLIRLRWRALEKFLVEAGDSPQAPAEVTAAAADPAAWISWACDQVMAELNAATEPLTVRTIGQRLPEVAIKLQLAPGKPYSATAGAHTRIVQGLGYEGRAMRAAPTGGWTSGEYLWTGTTSWLGKDPFAPAASAAPAPASSAAPAAPAEVTPAEVAEAAAELALRYLQRFGPATTADLTWWTGWTKTATTAALKACAAQPVSLEDGSPAWVAPDDEVLAAPGTGTRHPEEWVAFLPGLDPTAMGWKERAFYLGQHTTFGGPLFDVNGNIGPTVWVDGQVVGSWSQDKKAQVVFGLLETVAPARRAQLEAAAAQLTAHLDGQIVKPRFPTPMQRELSA